MRAGLLTEQIEILSPEITKNSFGEESTEWKLSYRTRARVLHDSGNRATVNDEIFYQYIKTFIVRLYTPISNFDRIRWNDKIYRVLDIEPDKALQQLTIKTELVND